MFWGKQDFQKSETSESEKYELSTTVNQIYRQIAWTCLSINTSLPCRSNFKVLNTDGIVADNHGKDSPLEICSVSNDPVINHNITVYIIFQERQLSYTQQCKEMF